MAIKAFERENLKMLRSEIHSALATVAMKHGISLSLGGITFTSNNFRCKINGDIVTGDGSAAPAANSQEIKWRRGLDSFAATVAGLTSKDAGKMFNLYGETYVLVGFRPNAKMKVVAQKPGRKSYTALPHQPVFDALREE